MVPETALHVAANAHTRVTFRALVEAIIPDTPILSMYSPDLTAGAADLQIEDYMIWELDHNLSLNFGLNLCVVLLSDPTALLLDAGAAQLIATCRAMDPLNLLVWCGGPFSALSPADRFRAMSILENLEVDLGSLPPPYKDNGGLVKFMIDFLNRTAMFGFYSEWSAYGSTRLETPENRRLEYFPMSWRQVGYPGVSLGYRALRGHLLQIVRDGEGQSNV